MAKKIPLYSVDFERVNKRGRTTKALEANLICGGSIVPFVFDPLRLYVCVCVCVIVIWHILHFRPGLFNHCRQSNYPIAIHSRYTAVNSSDHMD